MVTFKIGDRVKVLNEDLLRDYDDHWGGHDLKKAIITDIDNNDSENPEDWSYNVEYQYEHDDEGTITNDLWFSPEDLEKLQSEALLKLKNKIKW